MKLYLISLALLLHMFSFSQGNFILKGTVLSDNNKEPLPYASILLSDLKKEIRFATTSDSLGVFRVTSIPSGIYELKIVYLGFKPYTTTLEIQKNIELENIQLVININSINGVTIISNLPIIEHKVDRYVANIENTLSATGKNAVELLTLLPGIQVEPNGNIRIDGITGVTLMIDEKPTHLSGKSLINYLNSIRSDNVAKIEVRQQPTAEFDAAGLGGIINIITKRKTSQGWSGNTSLTIQKQFFSGLIPTCSIQYNRKDLYVNFNLSSELSKWLMLIDQSSQSILEHNILNISSKTRDTIVDKTLSTSLEIFYKINSKNNIGLSIGHQFWGKNEQMYSETFRETNFLPYTKSHSSHTEIQNMQNISGSLNYIYTIDTTGKILKFLFDFSNQYKYNVYDKYNYQTLFSLLNVINDRQYKSLQQHPFTIISAKLDYSHPINKHLAVNIGGKFSNVSLSDIMQYDSLTSYNIWQHFDERSYYFTYKEKLTSAYLSIKYNIFKNTTLTLGLRGENTFYNLWNDTINNTYYNLFPSFFFQQQLDKNGNHSIKISYSKRIQRVSFFKLSPYRYYNSEFEINEGNPKLQPELINTFRLSYSLMKKYYFSTSFNTNKNAISSVVNYDTIQMRFINTNINAGVENTFTAVAYIPFILTRWWEVVNQVTYTYYELRNRNQYINQKSLEFFSQHSIQLPKKFKLELLYKYNSPSSSGYTRFDAYHLFNLSFQKQLMKENLAIKLDIQRLIWGQKSIMTTKANDCSSITSMSDFPLPYFSLTLSYSFSGKYSKSNTDRIENSNSEELNRTY